MNNNGIQQFHKNSNWRVDEITIEGHEVHTQNYLDGMKPNIFVISNPSRATLKMGISSLPRTDRYEFKTEPNSVECFGRPIETGQVYILNDSDIDVKVILFSVNADFDPTILKNMNVILEGSQLVVSSSIDAIGNGVCMPVAVTNFSTIQNNSTEIANLMSKMLQGNDAETFVTLLDLLTTQNNVVQTLNYLASDKIPSIINNLSTVNKSVKDYLKALIRGTGTDLIEVVNPTYLNNASSIHSLQNPEMITMRVHFDWLCNDSDAPLTIYTNYTDSTTGATELLTLLPSEKMQDFNIEINPSSYMILDGDRPIFRAKYCYYNK